MSDREISELISDYHDTVFNRITFKELPHSNDLKVIDQDEIRDIKRLERDPYDPKLRTVAAQNLVYNVRDTPIGNRTNIGYGFGQIKTERLETNIKVYPPITACSKGNSTKSPSPKKSVSKMDFSKTKRYEPLGWPDKSTTSNKSGLQATTAQPHSEPK